MLRIYHIRSKVPDAAKYFLDQIMHQNKGTEKILAPSPSRQTVSQGHEAAENMALNHRYDLGKRLHLHTAN